MVAGCTKSTMDDQMNLDGPDDVDRLLLLGSILLLLCRLFGLDDTELVQALVSTGFAERLVGRELCLLLGDGPGGLGLVDLGDWDDRLANQLSCHLYLFLCSLTLVGLGELLGEEDELGTVLSEALDVLLKGLDALVTATVVNGNADGPGEVLVETSGLNLLQGEATT